MAAGTQTLDNVGLQPVLDNELAWRRRARVVRAREVFGVEVGRVDGLLQIEAEVDVRQEEVHGPLVLLVSPRGAEGQIRLTLTQRQRGCKGGAGPLSTFQ